MSLLRPYASCGLTLTEDGDPEVIVAGGFPSSEPTASVEIFNPGAMAWRDGPGLPVGRSHSAYLQYGEDSMVSFPAKKIKTII